MDKRKQAIFDAVKDFNVDLNYNNWTITEAEYKDKFSDRKHQLNTGRASKLYITMKEAGAANEELFAIWSYMMICINARDLHLDMDKAAKDFNFFELEKKYGRTFI